MSMFTRDQIYNTQNVIRTKSLFSDFGVTPETSLSLEPTDKGFPDLHSLFVALTVNDPSEATFAQTVFGDIVFWSKLQEVAWLKEKLVDWRHEADVKRKSIAFEYILKEIKEDGRNGYHAAKYLIDEPWKPRTKANTESKRKSSAEALPADVTDLAEFIKNRR